MKAYSLADFDAVPSRKEALQQKLTVTEMPDIEKVKAEARWTTDMVELFEREYDPRDPDKVDRSSAMARLAYSGAELGWTDEQILSMLYDLDSRWGKYKGRRKETIDNIMLNFVNRAREKWGYGSVVDIDLSKFIQTPDVQTVDVEKEGIEQLVYGFQDFVESDFPIDWMVEGLLPKEGIGLFTGYPGVGKTQFGIGLGAHLALGQESWLKWPILGGPRRVLFLSLEMGKPPLRLFMDTIGNQYPDKLGLNRNFKVVPFGKPVPLDTKEGQAFLNNLLEEQMPDLLIIDSLQRSISKEMTDELAAKNLMHYLAVLRSKYKCAVVMIHHNRKKPNEAANKQIAQLSDVYGSIFFTADVDFALSIDKIDTETVVAHSLKNRLGKELPPFELHRNKNLHFEMEWEGLGAGFEQRGPGTEEKDPLDV